MMLVLLYGACLVVSVLVSGVAARTVLSTTLVFLVSGAVIGQGGLGLVDLNADSEIVGALADLALFTVLFTDGGALRAPPSTPQPASMVPTIAAVRTRPRIFFFISYPPKIL